MIKKCLALSLFSANLVSFMGSLNIHAMDGGCARPEKLACCSADGMLPVGLTSDDLEEELIQRVRSIYRRLEGELTFVSGESKKIGEYSSVSERYNKDVAHTLRNRVGNCRMITHRFIFEFLKEKLDKTEGFVKICPLTITFADGSNHVAVTLITKKKVYVIDLSMDLQNKSERGATSSVSYIFTAQEYVNFMKFTCLDNQPVYFYLVNEDVTTCEKNPLRPNSFPLECVCKIYDSLYKKSEPSEPSECSIFEKYKVPAVGEGLISIVFSFLTGRDIPSGKKDDSLETISYEDLIKTPLLSEILSTEIAKKMSEGTAVWTDYFDAAESLSEKGKKLSDEDADKFITEYLKNIDRFNQPTDSVNRFGSIKQHINPRQFFKY